LAFVRWICELPKEEGRSNWYDRFTNSADLKEKVVRRLCSRFQRHVASLALRPERLVRLYFVFAGRYDAGGVCGFFRNAGVGPALRIRHGVLAKGVESEIRNQGGLAEGEDLRQQMRDGSRNNWSYPVEKGLSHPDVSVFCEYENRFGDRYRVEVPLHWDGQQHRPEVERFFVASFGEGNVTWTCVDT